MKDFIDRQIAEVSRALLNAFTVLLVIGIPIGILYLIVKLIKWCWYA